MRFKELTSESVPELQFQLINRKLWFDIETEGFLPTWPLALSFEIEKLAAVSPTQQVFWCLSTASALMVSYPQPDQSLKALRFWAGDNAEGYSLVAADCCQTL